MSVQMPAISHIKRCPASKRAGPRGGFASDPPICGWYWRTEEDPNYSHHCQLLRSHEGDHRCAEGSTTPQFKGMHRRQR